MKADAKKRILEKSARIVLKKGFYDTGLQEVLAAARVPKGSFYFHFKSKEDFGLELIDFYADFFLHQADKFLKDESLPPLERIRRFFNGLMSSFAKKNFNGGCPIGNLSLEMGDRNDRFRLKLKGVIEDMKNRLAACLKEAGKRGELPASLDAAQTADFIFSSFEGALLQMKVLRSTDPQKSFDRMIFKWILRPPQKKAKV